MHCFLSFFLILSNPMFSIYHSLFHKLLCAPAQINMSMCARCVCVCARCVLVRGYVFESLYVIITKYLLPPANSESLKTRPVCRDTTAHWKQYQHWLKWCKTGSCHPTTNKKHICASGTTITPRLLNWQLLIVYKSKYNFRNMDPKHSRQEFLTL